MLNLLKIREGESLTKEELLAALDERMYRPQDFVSRPGDYAPRGHVVDVYPFTYQSPVRVSFGLDAVESIHSFSLTTGDVLAAFPEIFVMPLSKAFENRLPAYEKALSSLEPFSALAEMRQGDFVVHLDYGIGIFLGFKRLKVKGEWKKHFAIQYADEEILYVETALGGPLLQRYIGLEGRKPKLNKLRGKEWARVKEKTRRAVKGVAADMLRLAARRNGVEGFRYSPDHEWQKRFEEEFPYEETPDQLRATDEVKRDMESPRPMDRLLCGDVGYGKTEVAMRAAFKAVMDHKQVAILVPTTILAEQHGLVLAERVRNFPVTVEVLSRFKTKKEQQGVIEGLKRGIVDVVIGTHRLLGPDVKFSDLGLVIIDEEQRFGVRHKEKLKKIRELVDVLTLTATPIPRTLYLSLVGARDMSVIATPPQGRIPIETRIIEFEEKLVGKIFEREVARSGQIYFVHNRIETIERIHHRLAALMPGVRMAVAHGRLAAHALEDIMRRFLAREIDCLLSTNIIESGLDIPNVNTILVNRADAFGLADLYQLRGRVGRFSERQAYAYFIVPKDFVMSGDAGRRMRAIERFTELGSGFRVAMEDLEIRGAGNILGEEQSGFIYQVGFDLYCRLLQQAIQEETGGAGEELEHRAGPR